MSKGGMVDVEESLVEIVRRTPILTLLAKEGPQGRTALEEKLGVSRSTSHRSTRALGEMGLVRIKNAKVGLTITGQKVARAAEEFTREVSKEITLAPLREALDGFEPAFPEDALREANVTDPLSGDPFQPVRQFLDLIEHTQSLRGLDIIAIAPLYLDEAIDRIIGGMKTEEVASPEPVRTILKGYPDRCHAACSSGNLQVYLHHNLPFAMLLLDDHMAIGIRQPGSRQLRVLLDTDDSEAMAWAELVYKRYREQAARMPQFSTPAYQQAVEALDSRVRTTA